MNLLKITADNVEDACRLSVRPDQDRFVSPVSWSLAEAYAQPAVAWPRLVYDGTVLVGFVMAFVDIQWRRDDPTDFRSGIWRLNIAAENQRRGYGRYAVEAVCDELRKRGTSKAYVTWEEGEGGPADFYLGLGFRTTGETSGGQTVGVRQL